MSNPDTGPDREIDETRTDQDAAPSATDVDADGLGDGRLSLRAPIEPGDPDAENALFVVAGALGTVALLASAILPGVL